MDASVCRGVSFWRGFPPQPDARQKRENWRDREWPAKSIFTWGVACAAVAV